MLLFSNADANGVLLSEPILNGDEPINVEIEVLKDTAEKVHIISHAFAPSITVESEATNKDDCASMFVDAFKAAFVSINHCSQDDLKRITLHLVVNTGHKLHIWYAWAI